MIGEHQSLKPLVIQIQREPLIQQSIQRLSATATAETVASQSYTVANGDTLWDIACTFLERQLII